MSDPLLLVQLSDPHVGATWGVGDPATKLASVVAAVRALQPSPAAVLVTGDLADHGAEPEYRLLRELLAPLELPVHVIVGNHDDRAVARRQFELPGSGDEPVQYGVEIGALRLVALDSKRPGADSGEFDPSRLAWLEATLAQAPDAPTLVAIHHPPWQIGLPAFDSIGLTAADREALAAVIERYPAVRAITAGHVHLAGVGTFAGVPALTAPSTYTDAVLGFDLDELAFEAGPPGYMVHALVGRELITHFQTVDVTGQE